MERKLKEDIKLMAWCALAGFLLGVGFIAVQMAGNWFHNFLYGL